MEDEIDIKDLIIELWRKKWIVLGVTFIFFLLGIVIYMSNNKENKNVIIDKLVTDEKDIYSEDFTYVETDFILARGKSETIKYSDEEGVTTNQTTYKLTIDNNVIANLNGFANSKAFLNEVNIDKNGSITIFAKENSDILSLVVSFDDEDEALNISNRVLSELTDKISKIYRIEEIIIIDEPRVLGKKEIKEFNEKLKKSDVNGENNEDKEDINNNANSGKSKKKIVLITSVGFVLACGIITVMELFNSSVKDERELERVTNLKTLAKIPKNNVDMSNRFKLLRVNINECKTILVTSPEVGDGKSFVAMNLANSFSKLEKKVLLVDLVNNSNDIIQSYSGKGLTDYLGSTDKIIEKYIVETKIKGLNLLLAGSDLSNQTELLESTKMKETLDILEKIYDVVIIDSSNVIDSANTLGIAKIARYTILVVSERKTKLENVIRAKNNIEDIGGNVIGNVLNKSNQK